MTTASGTREVPFARPHRWRALTAPSPCCPVCDVSYVFSETPDDGGAAPIGTGTRFVRVPGRLDGLPPPPPHAASEEIVVGRRAIQTRTRVADAERGSTQVTVTVTHEAGISVEKEEDGWVLHLRGHLDTTDVNLLELRRRLEELTVAAIAVRELAYLDSTAPVPAAWARRSSRAGRRAVIRGGRSRLRRDAGRRGARVDIPPGRLSRGLALVRASTSPVALLTSHGPRHEGAGIALPDLTGCSWTVKATMGSRSCPTPPLLAHGPPDRSWADEASPGRPSGQANDCCAPAACAGRCPSSRLGKA